MYNMATYVEVVYFLLLSTLRCLTIDPAAQFIPGLLRLGHQGGQPPQHAVFVSDIDIPSVKQRTYVDSGLRLAYAAPFSRDAIKPPTSGQS